MAVPLSWGTSLADKVTLSPAESQLSPCKTQSVNIECPPAHLSSLEVSSYANSQEPPPSLMSFSPSTVSGEWTCNRQRRAATHRPIEEQEHSDGSARAALASTTVTTRLCEYCTHKTDGESLSLTAPGKRPYLSYKHRAWRAPQVLSSAVPEGLEADSFTKSCFLALRGKHTSFTNASSPYLLPTSLGNRSQTCPCHWRCVNRTGLCLPQCLWLSNAVH